MFKGNENQRVVSMCLLYQLSIDDKAKKMFTFTECVLLVRFFFLAQKLLLFRLCKIKVSKFSKKKVMKLIIESQTEQVDFELIALGVNLAMDEACATLMVNFSKKKGLKYLIKRAFKFNDSLVMKMVRNISRHESLKQNFLVNRFHFYFLV
jgi:hypothetical protein